jgi:hypothetical protein
MNERIYENFTPVMENPLIDVDRVSGVRVGAEG